MNFNLIVYNCESYQINFIPTVKVKMDRSCSVCGGTNEKAFSSASDSKGQVKNIHKTLDELEIVKEENDQLKQLTENKLANSNDKRMGDLKARYIELLHRKEKLQEQIGKRKSFQLPYVYEYF